MKAFRLKLRALLLGMLRGMGSPIYDAETGCLLGRAFIWTWRGKIHVIGLEARVRPVFLKQDQAVYWKQDLGFVAVPPPDFPNVRKP